MKKIILSVILITLMLGTASVSFSKPVPKKKRVVAAYLSYRRGNLPDTKYLTHVNFAFGKVDRETFDKVRIARPENLKKVVALKETNPKLKVVLSIGGWGAGGFSEMASNEERRNSFINDCVKKCEEFNLDGIDIDWEYPTSSAAGIKSSPDDMQNFTLLIKGLREALGNKRILSYASVCSARYANWGDVIQYLDFVNIMAYDMGRPPYHNAALHPSELSKYSVEEAIDAHLKAGIPAKKLILGVPFYGHGNREKKIRDYVNFKDVYRYDNLTHKYDEKAMVPYIVDEQGTMLVTYDDEESIKLKCEYALKRGLLGVMYWEFTCDDNDQTLTKQTYNSTMNFKK